MTAVRFEARGDVHAITFSYDSVIVELLKLTVPNFLRSWNPVRREWLITEPVYATQFADTLRSLGTHARHRARPGPAAARHRRRRLGRARCSNGSDPIGRCSPTGSCSKLCHPDHGGDHASSTRAGTGHTPNYPTRRGEQRDRQENQTHSRARPPSRQRNHHLATPPTRRRDTDRMTTKHQAFQNVQRSVHLPCSNMVWNTNPRRRAQRARTAASPGLAAERRERAAAMSVALCCVCFAETARRGELRCRTCSLGKRVSDTSTADTTAAQPRAVTIGEAPPPTPGEDLSAAVSRAARKPGGPVTTQLRCRACNHRFGRQARVSVVAGAVVLCWPVRRRRHRTFAALFRLSRPSHGTPTRTRHTHPRPCRADHQSREIIQSCSGESTPTSRSRWRTSRSKSTPAPMSWPNSSPTRSSPTTSAAAAWTETQHGG